jgi:hypothetical protein
MRICSDASHVGDIIEVAYNLCLEAEDEGKREALQTHDITESASVLRATLAGTTMQLAERSRFFEGKGAEYDAVFTQDVCRKMCGGCSNYWVETATQKSISIIIVTIAITILSRYHHQRHSLS